MGGWKGEFMKYFFKENWFKIAIIIILVSFGVYHFITSSQKRETTGNLNNDIALQAKCADQASVFYKQGKYDDSSKEFSSFYTNHWNKKMGKCFIQINTTSLKDDYASIDIYDAFEGKQYALYIGHNICDVAFTNNPKKCQLDSGKIWFDGNDIRNPADYHVGFQGITVGPGVGDENTQKQFIDHIQPLMTE
jgi:hypothetical protein